MSTPSAEWLSLPDAPRHLPPLALERRFVVLEADCEATPDLKVTNARALELLEGRQPAWVVIMHREESGARYYAVECGKLRDTLRLRKPGGSLSDTLSQKFNVAITLTLAQYQRSAASAAIVLKDDVPVGVTVPRADAGRGESVGTRGGDEAARGFRTVSDCADHVADHHRLDALMPPEARLGETVMLVVTLDRVRVGFEAADDLLLENGDTLDISVQPGPGLHPLGTNTLPLSASKGSTSSAVAFKFSASSVGSTTVKVYAFNAGHSVAMMMLYLTVLAKDAPTARSQPEVGATMPLPEAPSRHCPDISLLVIEGNGELRFRLQSKLDGGRDFPARAAVDSREHFRRFAGLIEGLPMRSPDNRADAHRKIAAWGAGLFDQLIPPELQAILWQRQGDITVQICSDDAWIPWEACQLMRRTDDGAVEGGPFFAEAYSMTRWLHGRAAPERFRLARCALIVPTSSGLATAPQERAFYLGLGGAERIVTEVAPRYRSLTQAFETGKYDAWHFCGHGSAGGAAEGDRATLRLDGNESMSADLFAGTPENALLTSPFVFLNACQSAVGDQTLTGVGGWAHRFIRANPEHRTAAVFIGTYWSVYDAAAHQFAVELYNRVWAGQPIGTAAREARRAAQLRDAAGNPTDPLSWLAFTVYADPLAVLEKP